MGWGWEGRVEGGECGGEGGGEGSYALKCTHRRSTHTHTLVCDNVIAELSAPFRQAYEQAGCFVICGQKDRERPLQAGVNTGHSPW